MKIVSHLVNAAEDVAAWTLVWVGDWAANFTRTVSQ